MAAKKARTSYYTQIEGVKYERSLLELAKTSLETGGVISDAEAKTLVNDALDGTGVTPTEKRTLEYIMKNMKMTVKGKKWLEDTLNTLSVKQDPDDTPKQAVEPERKMDRSAEILNIPSQAEAASSIGDGIPLYEFVPPGASISTASQVGEVKNGDICIIWKEDGHGHFHVQHKEMQGWAAAEHFRNRKYRLLLNLMLCQEFVDVYKKTLEAIGKFGCCTVLHAFREGRTYAHLTLNYDFEVDADQLVELIAALETFSAANERVPLRMKGVDAFGASVIFLDVDRQHVDYHKAMKLHVDLLKSLQCLGFTKSKKDEKDIHWHATVAYKDFAEDKKCEILTCARDTATPVDCYFDNVTIMAKVGPSQAYVGTAKAVMSFPLKAKQ